jgi:hypothetical protein
MGKLERSIVRWAIASLFFAVELLFLVVIPDPGESSRYEIPPFNQAIMTVVLLVLFAIVPSILKEFASKDRPLAYAADQVETTCPWLLHPEAASDGPTTGCGDHSHWRGPPERGGTSASGCSAGAVLACVTQPHTI